MLAQKIRAGTPQGGGGAIETTMIGGGLEYTSPHAEIYSFSAAGGFGSRWGNPSTLPPRGSNWLEFSPDRSCVAMCAAAFSDTLSVYDISSGAWGSRLSLLTVFNSQRVAFNPSGNVLVVMVSASPYIKAYSFDSSTGVGSAFSDPVTVLTDTVYSVAFSPDESLLAVCYNSFPYFRIYSWDNSTGFGSAVASPTLPNRARGVAFNSDGSALFVCGQGFIQSYSVSGTTLALVSSLVNPFGVTNTIPHYVWDIKVSPDDSALIASGYLTTSFGPKAYPLTGATIGSKFPDPSSGYTSYGYGCDFTSDGSVVVSSGGGTPYIRAWSFSSSSGFGSALSAPAVAATANWRSVRCG